MKRITDMTPVDLVRFHGLMARELGVKFVGDPGFLQRLVKMIYDRLMKRVSIGVPEKLFRLRPMCFKNIIFLPWIPGQKGISPLEQICVAIHEATHALRIRRYPSRASRWYGEYFTKGAFRALEENSAQSAEAEFRYWYDGVLPDLHLADYALSDKQIKFSAKDYELQTIRRCKKFGRGYTAHRASRIAIQILKDDFGIVAF